jgi:glycosyl transferase family 25
MKAYIINLPMSTERKKHMERVIGQCNSIMPIFIEAVDGRAMTEEERKGQINLDRFFIEHGRTITGLEAGCTLSHCKVYKNIIDAKDKYAMVFEDDIEIMSDINDELLLTLKPFYDTNIPTIILLSGKYWFYKLKKISDFYKIATVFDAWGAYGYIINNSAAKIILNEKPFWVADDYWYLKPKGIRFLGVRPHIIDAIPRDVVPSCIYLNGQPPRSHIRSNMSILKILESYYRFGMRKVLKFIGLHEPEYQRR